MAGIYAYRTLLHELYDRVEGFELDMHLLGIFANYGILLLLIITTLCWGRLGMSSLGALYLITVVPLHYGVI